MEKPEPIKPGIYAGIANDDYHGGPGISKSGLDLIHRSPMHYRHAVTAANDNDPTTAQRIGTAFHSLVLEPAEFSKTYCLELRRSDVPDAIDDRDQLAAMVHALNDERQAQHAGAIVDTAQLVAILEEMNADRLPKIPTGGSKAELIARIISEVHANDTTELETLQGIKAADLKLIIDTANESRPGLLPASGSRQEMIDRIRQNGRQITVWQEICAQYEQANGRPYVLSTSSCSRHDMAAWLNANGVQVTLWSDALVQWQQNNADRIVLTADEWDQLHAMRDAVMAHPVACKLLTAAPGDAELSVYWTDPETGELCRCRPDFWRRDGILVDVKTTDDASPEAFARSLVNWRYHVQHPYYLDGVAQAIKQAGASMVTPRHFLFLVVEKKAPHAVAVYRLNDESVDAGRREYRRDLDLYAKCRQANNWPGYPAEIQPIDLPTWYLIRSAEGGA